MSELISSSQSLSSRGKDASLSSLSSSVELKTITTVFRPILVQYLDPNWVLSALRLQLGGKYLEIHELSLAGRRVDAVERLLTSIEELEDKRGISRAFMIALRRSGCTFLHDVITGKETLDDSWELYRVVLQTDQTFMQIPPLELIDYLPCLGDFEKERIETLQRQQGDMTAARELFLRLEAKPPSTLNQLIQGLKRIKGFDPLAQKLENVQPVLQELRKEPSDGENKNATPGYRSTETGPEPHNNIVHTPEDVVEDRPLLSRTCSLSSTGFDPRVNNALDDLCTGNLNFDSSVNACDGDSRDENNAAGCTEGETVRLGNEKQTTENPAASDRDDGMHLDVAGTASQGVPDATTEALQGIFQTLCLPSTREDVVADDENVSQPNYDRPAEGPLINQEHLNLYDYQDELAEPALGGKNTIIVAPTGSGKTRVAVAIAMKVMDENSREACNKPAKVFFIVNKVPLVEQQKNAFQKFFRDVVGISGDMSSHVPLVEHLRQADVIVLTAQILVNAIQDGSFSLSMLGLLIMDECHNTQKGNAYNSIMASYRDLKREKPDEPLPQVVGLTASLGVKKAKRHKDAELHILRLCANLDAEEISKVRKHVESLARSHHRPKEMTLGVRGRDDKDPFKIEVGKIMARIEEAIFTSPDGKKILKMFSDMKDMSSHRGTQQYEGEVSKLVRHIPVHVEDARLARVLQDCAQFLQIYNQSLYINRDARTIDAVNHVKAYIQTLKDKSQDQGQTMGRLIELFEDQTARMEEICGSVANENPVLKKLEEILETEYQEKPETLAILFTNTRDSTRALQAWIEDSPKLRQLNPGILIGSGKTDGMTTSQQERLLAMFKEKKHKLVISTSVAEEGLDIQMCNLVLRYNYVRDDIGRVQARGRSRAEGGKFYLIFNDQLPNLAERERMNTIREHMMERATETICEMIRKNNKEYQENVAELQKADFNERTLKKSGTIAAKKRKEAQRVHSEVKLICKHCREFACFADDIKCINEQHHIVMSDDFDTRINTIALEAPTLRYDVTVTKEILCKKCNKQWGYSMIYKGHELPLLSIKFLVIEIAKGNRYHAKRWKEVPFKIKAIDLEDLTQRLDIKEPGSSSGEDEKDPE